MPDGLQVLVKLAPSKRRWCKSMKRLIEMISVSDAKEAARVPPRAYLPVFPLGNAELQAALLLVMDRLDAVITPVRGAP